MDIPLKQHADNDVSRVACHVHVNISWWGTMCWLRWCWLMVSKLLSLRRTEETNSSMKNRKRMCVLGNWYEGNLWHLHHVVAYAMIVCDRCVSDRVRHIRRCICKSRPKAMYRYAEHWTWSAWLDTRSLSILAGMATVLMWLGILSVYTICNLRINVNKCRVVLPACGVPRIKLILCVSLINVMWYSLMWCCAN